MRGFLRSHRGATCHLESGDAEHGLRVALWLEAHHRHRELADGLHRDDFEDDDFGFDASTCRFPVHHHVVVVSEAVPYRLWRRLVHHVEHLLLRVARGDAVRVLVVHADLEHGFLAPHDGGERSKGDQKVTKEQSFPHFYLLEKDGMSCIIIALQENSFAQTVHDTRKASWTVCI